MGAWGRRGTLRRLILLLASGGAPALPLQVLPTCVCLFPSSSKEGHPSLFLRPTSFSPLWDSMPRIPPGSVLLAVVLSHVTHQMGHVPSTWLLVQCLDRPSKARGPKGVRTTLGMLGSWPGSNTGRFPWGHCTGLPWDRVAPAALSGLRNPAPLPPSPVDAAPPRAACIWGLALDFTYTNSS